MQGTRYVFLYDRYLFHSKKFLLILSFYTCYRQFMTIVVSQFGDIISKIIENHVRLMYVNFSFFVLFETLDKRWCKYGKLEHFIIHLYLVIVWLEQSRLLEKSCIFRIKFIHIKLWSYIRVFLVKKSRFI